MKTRSLLALGALLLDIQWAGAQGTTFTYQGRLNDDLNAANGLYDFQSLLYTSPTTGTPLGPPLYPPILPNSGVGVTNGLFTMLIQFGVGPNPFNGQSLWLELQVRTNGSGSYTTLAPRQKITATPYASYATTAASATTAGSFSGALAGDVMGTQSATTVGRIRGVNVSLIEPSPNQHLRFDGANWAPGAVALGSDVSGTLPLASGGTGAGNAAQAVANLGAPSLATSNTFSGVNAMTNVANSFVGAFAGNGSGLSNVPVASLPANVAYLGSNQTFTASNNFTGVVTANSINNQFNGTFTGTHSGNGAGLANLNPANLGAGTAGINISGNAATANSSSTAASASTATSFTGALAGDVTGTQGATVVGRLRSVNVSAGTPSANQHLRYDGANWTPGAVALGTDISGTLPVANGGTGAGSATQAVANLGAASLTASNSFSGVNKMTNAANAFAGAFSGDGAGLINLSLSGAVNTAALQNNAVTAPKIAAGQVVKSLNGLADAVTLAAGANVTLGTNANSLIISAAAVGGAASNAWNLTGNVGTTPGTNFIGTTDDRPVEFRVFNNRALRLESFAGVPNVVGGHSGNVVSNGVSDATIAGGGGSIPNRVTAFGGAVGGGDGNVAGNETSDPNDGNYATVGGGLRNKAGASQSVVGGGVQNTNTGVSAVIGGGYRNRATALYTVVSGGDQNLAGGWYSSVPGGSMNEARGDWSLAAGRQAKATHQGAFVWADSTAADFASTAGDQFNVRANGGVRLITGGTGATLDGQAILAGTVGSAQLAGTYGNAVTFNNPTNSFSGIGAGLTGLNGANLQNSTVAAAKLGTDVGLWNVSGADVYRAGGNVGVGTNNPQSTLHVNGTVQANGLINAAGGLVIEHRTNDPPAAVTGQIWLRTDL